MLQMHRQFLEAMPLQTLKYNLKQTSVKQRLATSTERRYMAFTDAVGARAACCGLLELHSLCDCLDQIIFEDSIDSIIASMRSIDTLPAISKDFVNKASSFTAAQPLVLPQNMVDRSGLKMAYGLHPIEQQRQPLKGQVEKLLEWLTEPVQLNRPGNALALRTRENIVKHIWQYLGFLQLHMARDQLSLWSFLDLKAYASYISFHRAKGNEYSTVVVHITTA